MSEAPPDLAALTEACCAIARRAGAAILDVYAGAFAVQQKADRSPLTAADLAAHRTIVSGLRALAPQWPILSEESAEQAAWSERRHWRRYWLVDPLDGTREFVKRNGEFTVNIALIEQHVPVLGVVYAPALGELYWAWCGGQARYSTSSAAEAVPLRTCPRHDPLRVAGSRSHRDPRTAAALARLGRHEWIPLGSALKFCRAARGEVDLYLRFGPTCEWDTAAGQCVLEQAGGRVLTLDGETLAYNAKESLINPDFLACGDGTVDWARVLADGGRSDSVRP